MFRKISFIGLWLGFIIYGFFLAPPSQPDTLELIQKLSLADWKEINPLIVALFNLMGILPLMYAGILFVDGRGQKLKAWPFVVASFAVGAFAILPYLAFRESAPSFPGEKGIFLSIIDSRWFGLILSLGAISLLFWGISQGDWTNFIQQWQTSRFINVMSLDFCLLSLLFPTLIKDDLARRNSNNFSVFWGLTFIPLLGALLYLCLRPPLLINNQEISQELMSEV